MCIIGRYNLLIAVKETKGVSELLSATVIVCEEGTKCTLVETGREGYAPTVSPSTSKATVESGLTCRPFSRTIFALMYGLPEASDTRPVIDRPVPLRIARPPAETSTTFPSEYISAIAAEGL